MYRNVKRLKLTVVIKVFFSYHLFKNKKKAKQNFRDLFIRVIQNKCGFVLFHLYWESKLIINVYNIKLVLEKNLREPSLNEFINLHHNAE